MMTIMISIIDHHDSNGDDNDDATVLASAADDAVDNDCIDDNACETGRF